MRTFLNLFGRSPFTPLQMHMQEVSRCVHMLEDLFKALSIGDHTQVEKLAEQISDSEHQADIAKNDIRNHLPKSLFLPIDRGQLLEMLSIQDRLANTAEEVAITMTLKSIVLPAHFEVDFALYLQKQIDCFNGAKRVIQELHELLEFSFGGVEADKVRLMVDDVALKKHEADIILRRLLKSLFANKTHLDFADFLLWQHIFESLASISDLSENLAMRVRMTLELK